MTDIAALVADNIHIWTGAIQRKSGAGRGGGGKRVSLYGIERLRALILDLAVRGELVPQDAADEPSSELLKRIAKAKAGMIREGVIRKPRDADLKDDLERPFEIPRAWEWVRLDQIAGCLDYMRIPVNEAERDKRIAGKDQASLYPYFGATQQQGWIDDYLFDDELVLLGEDGVPFFDPMRDKAYVVGGKTWVNNHAHVFKPILISSHFLVHYLNRFDYSGRIAGTTRTKLNQAKAVSIPTPLPPLAEQQRIVAKVDELMALCDALERESADAMAAHQSLVETLLATLVNTADVVDLARQWARLESHFDTLFITDASIDALKQTILALAVRGKLAERDARDKTAGRKESAKNAQLTPPFAIPQNWQCRPLRSLGRQVGGGTPSKSRVDFWDGPIPWISPKDMKRDYLSEAELSVSEAALQGSSIKMIAPESLLFVVRGMILAHSFPVAIAKAPVTINQDMKAIELYEPEMAEYLLRALKGLKPLMLARVERSSHGTCRLDSTAYGDFAIPIPPLAEQRRIVAKVDALMALCDALKARLADAAQTQRLLADAITERAAA